MVLKPAEESEKRDWLITTQHDLPTEVSFYRPSKAFFFFFFICWGFDIWLQSDFKSDARGERGAGTMNICAPTETGCAVRVHGKECVQQDDG